MPEASHETIRRGGRQYELYVWPKQDGMTSFGVYRHEDDRLCGQEDVCFTKGWRGRVPALIEKLEISIVRLRDQGAFDMAPEEWLKICASKGNFAVGREQGEVIGYDPEIDTMARKYDKTIREQIARVFSGSGSTSK